MLLLLIVAASRPFDSAHGRQDDPEPLFRALETGTPLEAIDAASKLARAWDDARLPRLVRSLEVAPPRALQLLGDLRTEGTAKLLLAKLPALLDSGKPETARQAVVAAGLRRLRAATAPLVERFEKLDERALLRALGRIWDRTLDDPPLEKGDEIVRLSVLAIAHRQAMGASSSVEACEAMLKVMGGTELGDFLKKHADQKFFARGHCDEAVRRRGFDPAKGARVHEALLASPDALLVADILAASPHALPEEAVRKRLDDRRPAGVDLLVCDAAAKRLTGKAPATREERDALLRSLRKPD